VAGLSVEDVVREALEEKKRAVLREALQEGIAELDAGKGVETSPDELMDEVACLLYGALNLDEPQFNQVYGVMQRLGQKAKQKGLSKETPAPEASEAPKQIMEQSDSIVIYA